MSVDVAQRLRQSFQIWNLSSGKYGWTHELWSRTVQYSFVCMPYTIAVLEKLQKEKKST